MTRLLAIVLTLLLPSALFGSCFDEAGKTYGLPSQLLEALAETESGMNTGALNINADGSFDVGLMQINSYWVRLMGLDKDRLMTDACYNVMTGARILKRCIDQYGYDWQAVGCYNAVSLQKRITYSWRVYQALSHLRKRPDVAQGRQPPSSSLVFDIKEIPEEQAAGQ